MKTVCLVGSIFFFLVGSGSSAEAVVDRVVAIVNQEIITFSELEKWKGPFLAEIKAEDRLERREQTRAALRKLLDRLVEEKLIDQEVKKMGLKLTGKEVEAAIEDIKQKNGMAQEQFEKALATEGVNFEGFKKEIEKQMLRMKALGLLMKTEAKPGEKEFRAFYQKNMDRYRRAETFRPAHILFSVPKGATSEEIQEIRKKCEKVLERIKKGDDFGEMAALYSEDASAKNGGELGFFKKGDLIPVLEREALRLRVGEVSGIVRTDFGFHIIKLLDRKSGEPAFEEVREKVEVDFKEKEMERSIRQLMTTLKEKAVIEIKL